MVRVRAIGTVHYLLFLTFSVRLMGVGPPGDEASTYTHSVYQAALSSV